MNSVIKKIYECHHKNHRGEGFVLMEKERGDLLRRYIGTGKNVLDIGCRDGALTKHFLQGNEVWGADIDEISLNRAEELGVKTILMDLNGDWPELNGQKFDVIVAAEVLEHLYYSEENIKKIVSFLNKDGILIGSVPNAFSLKNRLRYLRGQKKFTPLADPTHINQFNYQELETLLKKYFQEVEIIGLGRYTKLAKLMPNYFAFIFFFYAKEKFFKK